MSAQQREFLNILKELGLPTPVTPTRKQGDVPSKLQKDFDVLKNLLINNAAGPMEVQVGVFEEEKFKQAKEKLPEVLKKLNLEAKEKEFKNQLDQFSKVMKKFLESHMIVKAPVKTMPFKQVYLHKLPKIYSNEKGQLEINDKPVGYMVELGYQIERSSAYGELKDQKPLFAPVIGELELNWKAPASKPSPDQEEYIKDYNLQSNFFEAFDKQTTRNSIWRYQNYGRKGEPICDKLMANEDLMVSMERVISEVDSKAFKANASVCGLMFAIDGRTIVGIVDFDGVQKNAFEALFKLTAYMEDLPRAASGFAGGGGPLQSAAPASQGPVMQSSQPALPTWSEQDLANRPGKFTGSGIPNMPVWSEEELEKREDKFTGGGPNLPVWTEEELSKLKKTSSPSLNLPEWEDEGLVNCPKCGYSCQSDWDECPMCEARLEKKAAPPKPAPKPAPKPSGPPDAKKIE